MKNLKKLFFVVMLSVVTVISVACSASVSNDDVLTKFYENTKNIKSADVKSTAEITITPEGEGQQPLVTKTSISGTTVSEPLTFKLDTITTILGRDISINMYYKDNTLYIKSPMTGDGEEWLKTSDTSIIQQIYLVDNQSLVSSNASLELFKKKVDGIKVEEKDGKYEISFSGNVDNIKDIVFDILSKSTGGNSAAFEQIKNNMTFKSFTAKYVVDKSTYLPISLDSTIELEINVDGQKGTIKTVSSEKYENINKVSEIVLPDEVKNAKDINEA